MRILVTGGAGFIGSHVVAQALGAGHAVSVVDSLERGRRENLPPGVTLHRLDIRSPEFAALIADEPPEVVMHLAAQIDVRVSVADPMLDADVNVRGSLNLLEAARRAGVKKVIVASSGGCVYGEPKRLPVKETDRGRPESPYGISKRVLHDYLAFYRSSYGLDYTVLALGNVYGPRQDPGGEAGVVSIFIGLMLAGREPVIYGDGAQTRDFVHAGDVANAFLRAISRASGAIINIGTGVETSVLELWRQCAVASGYRGEPRFAPKRLGELERISLDWSRARRRLGWSPAVSLADGIDDTAAWVRSEQAAS